MLFLQDTDERSLFAKHLELQAEFLLELLVASFSSFCPLRSQNLVVDDAFDKRVNYFWVSRSVLYLDNVLMGRKDFVDKATVVFVAVLKLHLVKLLLCQKHRLVQEIVVVEFPRLARATVEPVGELFVAWHHCFLK